MNQLKESLAQKSELVHSSAQVSLADEDHAIDSQADNVDADVSKLVSSLNQTADEVNSLSQITETTNGISSSDTAGDNDPQASAGPNGDEGISIDDMMSSATDEDEFKNLISSLGQTSPQNFSDDQAYQQATKDLHDSPTKSDDRSVPAKDATRSMMSDADLDKMIMELKDDGENAKDLYLDATNDTKGAEKMNSLLDSVSSSPSSSFADLGTADDALLQEILVPETEIKDNLSTRQAQNKGAAKWS